MTRPSHALGLPVRILHGNARYFVPRYQDTPINFPSQPPTTVFLDFIREYFAGYRGPRVALLQEVTEHHLPYIAKAMGVEHFYFRPMHNINDLASSARNRLGVAIFSSRPLSRVRHVYYGDFDGDMPANWEHDNRGYPMSAVWLEGLFHVTGFQPVWLGTTHFTHAREVIQPNGRPLERLDPLQHAALDRLVAAIVPGRGAPIVWSADLNLDLNGPGGALLQQYWKAYVPPGCATTFSSLSLAAENGVKAVIDAFFTHGAVQFGDLASHDHLSDHLVLSGLLVIPAA
jgi:hypothetical protein